MMVTMTMMMKMRDDRKIIMIIMIVIMIFINMISGWTGRDDRKRDQRHLLITRLKEQPPHKQAI